MAGILVISPLSSHPPQNGARRRIHALLSALKRRGHKIHYVYTACELVNLDRMESLMAEDWDTVDVFPSGHEFEKSLGDDYGIDDWINPAVCEALPDLVRRYGATCCLTNYVFQSKYFDYLPEGVVKILDTHDKLSRRDVFEEMGAEPGFYYTTEAEEMRGLSRADVVMAIQDNEVDYFSRSGKPVVVVGHMTPVAYLEKRYTRFERIGYVGANNKFNVHSFERFLPAFADYVEETGAGLELSLAGNVCRAFKDQPEFQFDSVKYTGYIDDVAEYLKGIDLYLNPTFFGTGLKIKSVEALSYGLPVVSTAVGWDGLQGEAGYHDAETVEDLIAAVDGVRRRGFDQLTKLSNFSKASFSEYQLNLEANLINLFEKPPEEMLAWAAENPHYIGVRQDEAAGFLTLEKVADPAVQTALERPHIAHVVNPVRMPRSSDLYIAQPVAFRAMANAAKCSLATDVTLVARRFAEDEGYLEDCFDLNLPLYRSAQDLGTIPDARPLPVLAEVFSLDGLPETATHVVYTNSDIGVQPHFYDFAAARIAEGYDALVINRRTMPKHFSRASELNELYTGFGEKHPGFDCFVVSREVLERSDFADTLVGVHLIGRVIFWNIIARAGKIGYFDDHHLTFHIGDDVPSKGRATLPYIRHNLQQGVAVARRLQDDPGHFTESRRLARFDRVLRVSPGEIQGRFDPETEPRNRIFMHSFFRTGSTYIYQKMRNQKGWTSFYEPFHEDLALFATERLDDFRKRHANSKFRHATKGKTDPDKWLFAEYEALLDPGTQGVRGFDRRLSYMHGFPDSDETTAAYIAQLTEASPQENLFFQFNRTALRQDTMRALFPDDVHVYLTRDVRDIWGSYLTFQNNAVFGFLRNNLASLCFNAEEPLMQALGEHMPCHPAEFTFHFHSGFSDVFHHYTLEQHYLIHATFWYAALVQAARSSDTVIDMWKIARDPLVRLENEAALAALRMNVSFRDMDYKRYDAEAMLLSPDRMSALEARAREIVQTVEPDAELPVQEGGTEPVQPASLPKPDAGELGYALTRVMNKATVNYGGDLERRRAAVLARDAEAPELEFWHSYAGHALEATGIFLFGFHESERRHVWGKEAHCMLRFAVPDAGPAELHIRMHVHPLMAPRHQGAFVYLNGSFLYEAHLGPQMQPHVFDLSQELLEASGGIVEIGFVLPRHFKGTPRSKRALSLCVGPVELRRPGEEAPEAPAEAVPEAPAEADPETPAEAVSEAPAEEALEAAAETAVAVPEGVSGADTDTDND